MIEKELETSRVTITTRDTHRIEALDMWFRFEYPRRLNKINRYAFLGLECPETRYQLEKEAYEKENELRRLEGKEPLPPLKLKKIL